MMMANIGTGALGDGADRIPCEEILRGDICAALPLLVFSKPGVARLPKLPRSMEGLRKMVEIAHAFRFAPS